MSGQPSLGQLWQALSRPDALVELAVLAGCILLAYGLLRLLRPASAVHGAGIGAGTGARTGNGAGTGAGSGNDNGILFGKRTFDGVLFPLLALAATLLARYALQGRIDLVVLHLAVPLLGSLAIIRTAVRVLRKGFPQSRTVRLLERTISWGIWLALVLWLTGLLPIMLAEMEALSWTIGGAPVSLRSLFEGVLSAAVVLVAALWLSASIEARLMRAAGVSLSVRKIMANATRAALLLVGLLVALSAAGIPLGALGVMGGAVGVGIGLGLQKLASNYVSGFVILAERSLRIGDVVKVDGFEGRITDIKTRYTVIRALSGREAIVPNEMLITQRVESNTLADSQVVLQTEVQVAYGTDLAGLMPRLVHAVSQVPRVLSQPAPSVQLASFAADGLALKLLFWIADSENGTGNVTSDVNLALLATLTAAEVEIPFPQRVLHRAPRSAGASAEKAEGGG